MRGQREVQEENDRIKKAVADLAPDPEPFRVLSVKALKPAHRRKPVDGMLVDCGVSIRGVCKNLFFGAVAYYFRRDPF
ncbi:MAG: hypothetical protein DI528_10375 [Shinella sp.]|nr:MAG: hypothetical protein DI528_10375 [Shinella sp.]